MNAVNAQSLAVLVWTASVVVLAWRPLAALAGALAVLSLLIMGAHFWWVLDQSSRLGVSCADTILQDCQYLPPGLSPFNASHALVLGALWVVLCFAVGVLAYTRLKWSNNSEAHHGHA